MVKKKLIFLEEVMLIGELSKCCGLSRDTIRFYEKQGLIAVGKKENRFNNYKEYSDETGALKNPSETCPVYSSEQFPSS